VRTVRQSVSDVSDVTKRYVPTPGGDPRQLLGFDADVAGYQSPVISVLLGNRVQSSVSAAPSTASRGHVVCNGLI